MGVFNRGLSDQGSPKTTFQFFDGLVQIPMNDIRDPIQDVVLKSGGEWVPVTAKRYITAPKTGNLNILGIIVIEGTGESSLNVSIQEDCPPESTGSSRLFPMEKRAGKQSSICA